MEEELKRLQTENQELREQVKDLLGLREQNQSLQEQLDLALAQIEELKKQTKEPPAFVKANVSKPEHNGARKRETPTQIEEHLIRTCPDCHGDLTGITVSRRRQVIELPPRRRYRSRNTGFAKGGALRVRNGTKPHLNCHQDKSWDKEDWASASAVSLPIYGQ